MINFISLTGSKHNSNSIGAHDRIRGRPILLGLAPMLAVILLGGCVVSSLHQLERIPEVQRTVPFPLTIRVEAETYRHYIEMSPEPVKFVGKRELHQDIREALDKSGFFKRVVAPGGLENPENRVRNNYALSYEELVAQIEDERSVVPDLIIRVEFIIEQSNWVDQAARLSGGTFCIIPVAYETPVELRIALIEPDETVIHEAAYRDGWDTLIWLPLIIGLPFSSIAPNATLLNIGRHALRDMEPALETYMAAQPNGRE